MSEHIEAAAACLLPAAPDPTGTYSNEVYIRGSAFRVLAHAEIEAYLEDRAREVALAAVRAYKAGQEPSRTSLALLAYSGLTMKQAPATIRPPAPDQGDPWAERALLPTKMELAMSAFAHVIATNHGIKEDNLLSIVLPVGISVDQLDPVLIADMNSFSTSRGEAAHSSAVVRQRVDPMQDLASARSIVRGLTDLDTHIDALMGEVALAPAPQPPGA